MTTLTPPTAWDIDAVRADFPILDQEVHPGKPLVFLDSAASSQKPIQVIEAMNHYYCHTHANVHRGVHVLSEAATELYEGARDKVQKFINAASRKEVIFTRNTTESMNLIVQTWGRVNLGPHDVIVLSVMEHHANLTSWHILQHEKGFRIRYVPVTPDFRLDMDAYQQILREEPVKAVSIMHVSNVMGTINPMAEIVRLAHTAGAIAIGDGAQSVPHMPVDVQALDVDFYAFSGHKMCGPTGVGILYGKRALLEAMPPWMGGGDMIRRVTLEGSTFNDLPHKFEAGTPAIAEGIGMGAAVDYLSNLGMDRVHTYEREIADYLHDRLAEVPGLRLFNPDAPYRSSVATFTLDDIHAHDMAQILDSEGVAVRAGHHCAMPLHQHFNVPATSRASFYLYNSLTEVDKLVEALYVAKRRFSRK
ncbi:MAG: cysteine desulfurase [Chloroflexota bacterium]|nr:cysteine desulfurase [Chloroflexota bacterium]NOG62450.1 cysteine desulfurase [Chloroflexota bacterium]GIK64143.1 MAG: cysteine desulfurase [Chloroflexota bacterium]